MTRVNHKLQNNQPSIDYHAAPIVGSPDAPYVVILLFDYQCPHCQIIHLMLDEAVRRYGGKLSFVLCPAPLNGQCNPFIPRDEDTYKNSCELARINLAVWTANRQAFPAFEEWMFTYETGDWWKPRSPKDARAKAIELTGRDKFEAASKDPWIEKYLQASIRIYGQTFRESNGGVPKLIYGGHWVMPEAKNADELVKILQRDLGIPAPD